MGTERRADSEQRTASEAEEPADSEPRKRVTALCRACSRQAEKRRPSWTGCPAILACLHYREGDE